MSLFSKILGVGTTIAGVATGNPMMAVSGLGMATAKDSKGNVIPASNNGSFLNLDVSGIDPNYKNPAGYQPTTVKAPILPEDIATYQAVNNNPTYGQTQQRAQLDDSRALLEGILNPDSELNKRLSATSTQVARGDFLRNLRDMQAMDRKARSAGRPSLFGDDRGDENVSRMLMDNAQQAMYKGRATANELLNQAYGNSNNLATGFGNLANTQMNNRKFVDESNRYAIGQQREDTNTRTNQQRDDVYRMLQIADPQRSSMQTNQQNANYANQSNANAQFGALGGLLNQAKSAVTQGGSGNFLSDLTNSGNSFGGLGTGISDYFNGYTDVGTSLPWLS